MSLDQQDPQQSVLPIGTRDDLARADRTAGRVYCGCGADVTDTRRPHQVRRSFVSDGAALDSDDEVPVFGWRCERCHRVLALDPHNPDAEIDLGPGSGWLAVDATLADGSRGPVIVPSEVVLR